MLPVRVSILVYENNHITVISSPKTNNYLSKERLGPKVISNWLLLFGVRLGVGAKTELVLSSSALK
jgi:hypothetical protein